MKYKRDLLVKGLLDLASEVVRTELAFNSDLPKRIQGHRKLQSLALLQTEKKKKLATERSVIGSKWFGIVCMDKPVETRTSYINEI